MFCIPVYQATPDILNRATLQLHGTLISVMLQVHIKKAAGDMHSSVSLPGCLVIYLQSISTCSKYYAVASCQCSLSALASYAKVADTT